MRAAVFMMGSMAAFTVNDTFMKSLGGQVPLFQALFLRGVATVVFLIALAAVMGQFSVRHSARDWGLIALRGVGEAGAAFFFITALFNMPLANATAILQTVPLAVTLAGALFLRETVGWRRFVAIAVGFGGVLLIVRPGGEGFNHFSVYALISVACVTLRDLATRRLSREVPSLTVAWLGALSVTLFGGVMSTGVEWVPLTGDVIWRLSGSTVAVMGGYLMSILTMRAGDLGFVAPFRYTALIWGLGLGWFVFGEWPTALTLVGAGIIAATGLFTLLRERKLGHTPPTAPATLRIR